MKRAACVLGIALLTGSSALSAQSAGDSAAVRATALDYIEGWYSGDASRMEKALHAELAKRIVRAGPDGASVLSNMTAEELVEATRGAYGARTPVAEQMKEVTVLDIYENAASVKIVARDWIDYLHMARFDGRWLIVNVLWELKPKG